MCRPCWSGWASDDTPHAGGARARMLSLSFTPWYPGRCCSASASLVRDLRVARPWSWRAGARAILRALALALVLLAIANPSLVREDREPVKDIAAIVVDRSGSQALGDRPAMTDAVRAELQRRFGALTDIEPRFIDVPDAERGRRGHPAVHRPVAGAGRRAGRAARGRRHAHRRRGPRHPGPRWRPWASRRRSTSSSPAIRTSATGRSS